MNKEWYKSKAMWSALVVAVLAVLDAVGVPVPKEVYVFLGALGLAGVRHAQK